MKKDLPSEGHGLVANCFLCAVLCIALLTGCYSSFGQAELIRDINDSEEESFMEFSNLRAIDDKAFYVSEGKKLWVTYQDPAEDYVDKADLLGTFQSVDRLYVAGHTLYFVADDGSHGLELWQSNGTEDGTFMVKDIYPGASSANPENLTFSNGILYFTAWSQGKGKELWRSNGSAAGTMLVKDILPNTGSSNAAFLTDVNGVLYFAASDGTHGYELWKSNGTAAGTVMVKDIAPSVKVSSSPKDLVNVSGTLFFTAQTSSTGRELYKSDGTSAGTFLVKDIRPGSTSAGIENLTAMNGKVVFSANDGVYGHELWRSDGTSSGTTLVKDMTPGGAGSHGEMAFQHKISNFAVINGVLYFTAYKNNDYFIWKSDGTANGTVTITPAKGPGIGSPAPAFTEKEGWVYFFNGDYERDYNLFRLNPGTGEIQLVYYLYMTDEYNYYYPPMAIVTNALEQKMLYSWGVLAFVGAKMFRTLGTEETTEVLWYQDPFTPTESSSPRDFMEFNGKLAFVAQSTFYESNSVQITDGVTVQELTNLQHMAADENPLAATKTHLYVTGRDWLEIYKMDGGNYSYTSIADAYDFPPAQNLTATATDVYYTTEGTTLWKIDGATDNFTPLRNFYRIDELKSLGNAVVIRVRTATSGEEWWRTNGTESGTYRIKTVRTGTAPLPRISPSAMVKGAYYFVANNGTHGNEVWRTGGVGSNTWMVADLNTNDAGAMVNNREYDISAMASFRDSLYVSAIGNDGKWGLFKSNGAVGNIRKVATMNAVRQMAAAGNKLYLFVYGADNTSGLNLWVTNGTASGTKFLKALPHGSKISTYNVGSELFFTLGDGGSLWTSNGTECGTMEVPIGEVKPYDLSGLGSLMIFQGYNVMVGAEPYRYDTRLTSESPCAASDVAAMSTTSVQQARIVKTYPNPFINELSFKVEGEELATAKVSVTTMTGYPVMTDREFVVNEDHILGQHWAPGMYIMKVTYGGKTETSIVVKK